VYGSNILADPSFEFHVARTGKAGEVPFFESAAQDKFFPHYSDGTLDVNARSIVYASDEFADWFVDDTDPRSGTYHLATVPAVVTGSGLMNWSGSVHLSAQRACLPGSPWLSHYGVTARIREGTFCRVSVFLKATSAWFINARVRALKQDMLSGGGGPYSFNDDDVPLTTSYAQWSHSFYAPADSYWLSVWFSRVSQSPIDASDPPNGLVMRLDDFELEVG
jgi:hypothetical protein